MNYSKKVPVESKLFKLAVQMTQSGWSLVKANELHLMKGTFPGLRVEFLVGTRVANRPKFSLVLVPFFSAPSKNLLVLVPFFSALALSTISTRF